MNDAHTGETKYAEYYVALCFLGLTIPVVLVSSLMSCYTLYKLRDPSKPAICQMKKSACITVIILCMLFSVFTLTYTVRSAMTLTAHALGKCAQTDCAIQVTSVSGSDMGRLFIFLPMTLNSTFNPLVYISRKQEMREYFRELWRGSVNRIRAFSSTVEVVVE